MSSVSSKASSSCVYSLIGFSLRFAAADQLTPPPALRFFLPPTFVATKATIRMMPMTQKLSPSVPPSEESAYESPAQSELSQLESELLQSEESPKSESPE